jgi:broad specificity phosphatase PhoE
VSTTTAVHLLRHGEVHNPHGVLYGRLPGYHLSERGLAMAERLGEVLGRRDVTHLVSSPLERARETAAPAARALGLVPVLDERVIEAANVFEGKTFGVGDGSLKRPSQWRHLWNPFRPSWGEPYALVAARMLAALADARDAAAGHEAVVVSHQLPVWVARLAVEGRRFVHDPRRRQCSVASLTTITYEGTYESSHVVSVAYSEPAADLLPVGGRATFSAGA